MPKGRGGSRGRGPRFVPRRDPPRVERAGPPRVLPSWPPRARGPASSRSVTIALESRCLVAPGALRGSVGGRPGGVARGWQVGDETRSDNGSYVSVVQDPCQRTDVRQARVGGARSDITAMSRRCRKAVPRVRPGRPWSRPVDRDALGERQGPGMPGEPGRPWVPGAGKAPAGRWGGGGHLTAGRGGRIVSSVTGCPPRTSLPRSTTMEGPAVLSPPFVPHRSVRVLAHGDGGGWGLRHEGCAVPCCESVAVPTKEYACSETCEGCDGLLCRLPERVWAHDNIEACSECGACEGCCMCPVTP